LRVNKTYICYPSFIEAKLIRRLNSFVLELETKDGIVKAYLPNTSRLYEFLNLRNAFFLIPTKGENTNIKLFLLFFAPNMYLLISSR